MTEQPLSTLAVYSARPTLRVDGDADRRVTELLLGLRMDEQEGGLSALEARFSNIASDLEGGADRAFEDERSLALGSTLAAYGGDEASPQQIFSGTVTGLEAEFPEMEPPELLVLAEDAGQRARMTRRTAVHEQLTLADLASAIAARLGLQPVIGGYRDSVGTWVQLNESDLSFLRRLLQRHDGDLQIVGDELHVAPREEVRRGTLELELHSQLRSVRAIADLAHQVTEITASGWDESAGRRVTASSTGLHLGPGSGRSGSELLFDTLGERSEHLGHLAVTSDAEVRAVADAAFDRRARRFVCVEGRSEGNPALRVGTHVTLRGVSRRFDNSYYVVRTRHRWDTERGYETEFWAECAALGVAA